MIFVVLAKVGASRERGLAKRVNHPKSGMNSSQRIPSPFMGEG